MSSIATMALSVRRVLHALYSRLRRERRQLTGWDASPNCATSRPLTRISSTDGWTPRILGKTTFCTAVSMTTLPLSENGSGLRVYMTTLPLS